MEKKSLGTIIVCALLVAAFVAAVKQGINGVCQTLVNGDPFWVLFGIVVWGGVAATIWLVACLIWKEEI
jgi:hypothetical protein